MHGEISQEGEEISLFGLPAGLLVHAESAEPRSFYLHLVPEFEFETSPTDDLRLVLLMKGIRRTLRVP